MTSFPETYQRLYGAWGPIAQPAGQHLFCPVRPIDLSSRSNDQSDELSPMEEALDLVIRRDIINLLDDDEDDEVSGDELPVAEENLVNPNIVRIAQQLMEHCPPNEHPMQDIETVEVNDTPTEHGTPNSDCVEVIVLDDEEHRAEPHVQQWGGECNANVQVQPTPAPMEHRPIQLFQTPWGFCQAPVPNWMPNGAVMVPPNIHGPYYPMNPEVPPYQPPTPFGLGYGAFEAPTANANWWSNYSVRMTYDNMSTGWVPAPYHGAPMVEQPYAYAPSAPPPYMP